MIVLVCVPLPVCASLSLSVCVCLCLCLPLCVCVCGCGVSISRYCSNAFRLLSPRLLCGDENSLPQSQFVVYLYLLLSVVSATSCFVLTSCFSSLCMQCETIQARAWKSTLA